ncbi:phage tail protein [Rouxiella silvae]|jgi:phage tail protein X|uniref:Phage tail protein n=1 Tax=Rouxiella silvae TaxID=1646373 RepID=A0AA40WZZ9_9GAMM|nr:MULTISPECIES: tail protein X [Rouxiella]KQN46810.1 phage tail protein [Serratia sp. Leaf50]MBF6636200.1 tail protein X [Rouxiella silvae]MCC3704158.1 tail protein X [Rouxiella badensis]ORJ19757.1 phage tail protein [Rouxiella silvae]
MKAYAQQGDTVDLMCWRYYGRTESVLEQVLLANPGLADVGVMLPHGYAVEMPEITDATVRETVQLWD